MIFYLKCIILLSCNTIRDSDRDRDKGIVISKHTICELKD